MSIKFYLNRCGNKFGLPEGYGFDAQGPLKRTALGGFRVRSYIVGHIERVDTGRTYKGLGVEDLQRRLKYWTQRVGQVASLTAFAEGKAKKDADKLLKSGEKLIKTLSKQIEERRAA